MTIRLERRVPRATGPFVWVFPAIGYLLAVYVFPLVYSFALTFQAYDPLTNQFSFSGLSNYVTIFRDDIFWHSFGFTSIFTVAAVSLQFLLGFGIALFFQQDMSGREIFRGIMVVPTIVTPMICGLMWRVLLNTDRGLINYLLSFVGVPRIDWIGSPVFSVISTILVDTWEWSAFIFLILFAGLQVLPVDAYEAAKIDGASKWQTFRHVTLPLLQPVIMVALIFRGADAFRLFDIVYTLTYGGPSYWTYSMHFLGYKAMFTYSRIGYASAVSWVILVVCMLFMFAYYRVYYRKT